jgi:hypothetical protein
MSRSLILDARTQRAANSPLEIQTEPGHGPGVYITDHKYPDPDQEILEAGGREGKRRAGPPIMGNRQIPIEVFVMGRGDLAAAPVNLWLTAKGELTKKFGTDGADYPTTRELATGAVPSFAGEYRDKHAFDGVSSSSTVVSQLFTVTGTGAGRYVATLYVWIPANWTGSAPQLRFGEYTGSSAEEITAADLNKRDQWQRIQTAATIAAGDLIGAIRLEVVTAPTSAGTGIFYSDAMQMEKASTPTDYFDGDTPGSSWVGEPYNSESTQPAGGQEHFEAIVRDLESKLAKIRDEGGTYSRPYQTGRLTFDLEGLAQGDTGAYEGKRWIQRGQKFSTVFEALPYGRGETQTRTLRSQTTDPVLVFEETLVPGSVRALGELEITDTGATARRGFVGAVEIPDYDATAETAALYYQAENMTPLGVATKVEVAGAVGASKNTIQAPAESQWAAMASTKLGSGLHLTHVGTFRIFARVKVAGNSWLQSNYEFKLQWGQGDLIERVTNDVASIPSRSVGGFYIVDLGLVRIRPARVGLQRWEGQIIQRLTGPGGSEPGVSVNLDDIRIVPVKDAAVRVRAPRPALVAPTSFTGRDPFKQTAGALVGKTAEQGGVWAAGTGTGFETTGSAVKRFSSGLAIAVLPPVMTVTAVRASLLNMYSEMWAGIVVRFVDANNYIAFTRVSGTFARYEILKRVGGVESVLAQSSVPVASAVDLGVLIDASGFVTAYTTANGGEFGAPMLSAYDPVLATGGALASGKGGLYESRSSLPEVGENRLWDNYSSWAPTEPLLIASGRRLRWRHDGVVREDAGGGELWSPVGYQGDPLLVPPSTKEKRRLRVIAFPSRGDLQEVADEGASDDFTAQLALTSRHLSVR